MPLNSQEKRDAWPGQFTDFVLRLGGKSGLAQYPGHDFFNVLMKAKTTQDRGKFRQLAAQLAALFFTHREDSSFTDISSAAIDDYYYEHLGFDANSANARRLFVVLDKILTLLRDQKRPKSSATKQSTWSFSWTHCLMTIPVHGRANSQRRSINFGQASHRPSKRATNRLQMNIGSSTVSVRARTATGTR